MVKNDKFFQAMKENNSELVIKYAEPPKKTKSNNNPKQIVNFYQNRPMTLREISDDFITAKKYDDFQELR